MEQGLKPLFQKNKKLWNSYKHTSKISRTIATLSNEEIELNFFSNTKESWDDIVFQNESHLLLNTSIQEIDNDKNNNKEHMPEVSPESSGSSQHRTSSSGDP
ncbi:434_t:CDS:2 [Gigaspora rosea]|nr:434_t:CDS:2 [Gigaspora rosea]